MKITNLKKEVLLTFEWVPQGSAGLTAQSVGRWATRLLAGELRSPHTAVKPAYGPYQGLRAPFGASGLTAPPRLPDQAAKKGQGVGVLAHALVVGSRVYKFRALFEDPFAQLRGSNSPSRHPHER